MTFATVEAAKTAQLVARDDVWNALRLVEYKYEHADVVAANARYDATVTALREMLGPDAHCGEVDSDLMISYSDLFKDRCGFRPRGHVTYEAARAYVDSCKDSDIEGDDDDGEEWFKMQEEIDKQIELRSQFDQL